MSFKLGKTERLIIEIDVETGDYQLTIEYANLQNIRAALQNILDRIDDGTLQQEPGIEVC